MQASTCFSGQDYQDKFEPLDYLQRYKDVHQFRSSHMLHCYHTAFLAVPKYVSALDYGSGPTILPTISAATKASEIVPSNFLLKNRQALQSWLESKGPHLFDWDDHFRFVVKELEQKAEEEAIQRQVEVRNIVKAVVHCDLTKDPPIEKEYNKLYDVVTTAFVIEAIANSYEEYKLLLYRLTRFVKPNGSLFLHFVEDSQFYYVDDLKFKDFPLSLEMVTNALEECGIRDLVITKGYNNKTFTFITGTHR